MTIQLICDMCRQPKDSVEHYSLVRHMTKAETPDGKRGRRQYSGAIDICEDCIERVAHDGRDSAHKKLKYTQRVELGRVKR